MIFEYTLVIVITILPPKFKFVLFSPHLIIGFNIILFGKYIARCDTFTGMAMKAS